MENREVISLFEKFVPMAAAPYCAKLYDYFGFEFQIKKARKTKLGDYRFDHRIKKHTITINNDLNPFAFLITYLHEVAHLVTFQEHGRKVNPHGEEWKNNFKRVAKPVLSREVFPENVLHSLAAYLKNPKAASCSDPVLYQVLKQFDKDDHTIFLKALRPGDQFTFHKKHFKYISKRRTRMVCEEVSSGKKYLINQLAEVRKLAD
jgi:hypothetical protein